MEKNSIIQMVTFIIPNYNKPDMTLRAVGSLYAHTKQFKCIVVDDGSPTQKELSAAIAKQFPDVQYISLPENRGFAVACNTGLRAKRADSHAVLFNNDCELTSDAVPIIEKLFCEQQKIGVVGGLLRYPDGRIQHDGMDFQPRVPGAFIHASGKEPRQSRFCVSVTGALFAIRAEAVNKIGLLDESFFCACEDSDYCLRAWGSDFSVWFEQSLTATHIEGATRGRTPQEKRKFLGSERYAREADTVARFRQKHSDKEMKQIADAVRSANIANDFEPLSGMKIEIGCGYNPQPGFIACDARKLKGVAHVFDFGFDRWPFPDASCSVVLMNHSIEHVSYRRLPHVLTEAARVLVRGGKIIIRTPDLRFIVEKYLMGETTPEWPGDEKYIADTFVGSQKISPAWWANIKLFAGQDYTGNEHRFCFDFETLSEVLERFGFDSVTRHHDKPVFSPGEIYCEAVRQ